MPSDNACPDCFGTGYAPQKKGAKTELRPCPKCNGTGSLAPAVERALTVDDLAARIIVLEAMTMTAWGAAFRYGRDVITPELAIPILNTIKKSAGLRVQQEGLSAAGQAEAARYTDFVLSEFSESVARKKK